MEWRKEEFKITDDKAVIDLSFVTSSLNSTYWANQRPGTIIEKSFKQSVVLSLLYNDKQIGLSRIAGDYATFAWICDVFVHPDFRGQGLGKWLMECALTHPINDVQVIMLATKDAHGLYERYGFIRKECMIKMNPDPCGA